MGIFIVVLILVLLALGTGAVIAHRSDKSLSEYIPLLEKIGKIVGVILAVILVIWLGRACIGSSGDEAPDADETEVVETPTPPTTFDTLITLTDTLWSDIYFVPGEMRGNDLRWSLVEPKSGECYMIRIRNGDFKVCPREAEKSDKIDSDGWTNSFRARMLEPQDEPRFLRLHFEKK